MVKCLALVVAVAACQGRDDAGSSGSGTTPPVPRDAAVPVVSDAFDVAASDAGPIEEQPPDPGKTIDDLGAIPAWQAVVDRGQFLARRNQQGLVYGVLGDAISVADPASDGGLVPTPYTWLVDETEGNGSLAIRVLLGKQVVRVGERVALGGSWALDDQHKYYWKVESVTALPAAPPSTEVKDPPSPPGHDIVQGRWAPGMKKISLAADNDLVYFAFVGKPPALDGEGWAVADELGNPVFARLALPGERPSYGGQDFRTPDERWQLKRGSTYWVRIGKIRRPQGPDKPAVINARTPPVFIK